MNHTKNAKHAKYSLTTAGLLAILSAVNNVAIAAPADPAAKENKEASASGAMPVVTAPVTEPARTLIAVDPHSVTPPLDEAATSSRQLPLAASPVQSPDLPLRATQPPAPPRAAAARPQQPTRRGAAGTKTETPIAAVNGPSKVATRNAAPKPVVTEDARPSNPVSARADNDRLLLTQLQAELRHSQARLKKANRDLSEGQRQLSKVSNVLSNAMLEAGVDARGLHPFVKVAQRYVGTEYVWGGESGRGFDCSGFIIVVMRDLGYRSLPHSAAEQFTYGRPIAQAALKPGDLVFFANTYKPGISHVGIYLGKRRFIHAAGTGLGTIVSSLDNPKFQAKYAGARRLVAGGRR